MRKKHKLLILILTLIASLCLTSCSFFKTDDETDGHNYSTEWTTDTNHHWHQCTDSGCNKIIDYADHTFSEDWVIKQNATADEAGYKVIECTVCGYEKERQTILPTSHHYGTPSYEWNSNHTTCTATVSCTDNGCTDVVTASGTISSVTKTAATCIANEVKTYTATFANSLFTTQTVDVETANSKVAHTYSNKTYTWSSDNTTCTASATCTVSGCNHTETETVNSTSTITVAGTCDTKEKTKYTATFTKTVFTKQEKEVEATTYANHTYQYVDAKTAKILEDGCIAHYECSVCHKVFDTSESKTETTTDAVTLKYQFAKTYTQVSDLKNTDIENVEVIGVVISYSYYGLADDKTRNGFIIKDISTDDIVLVNGLNTDFGEYVDKDGDDINIGSVVTVKGNFYKGHLCENTSYQYFENLSVSSASDIEILESSNTIKASENIKEIKSLSELEQLIETTSDYTSAKYNIFKLTGTTENPIAFVLNNSGNISEKNMNLFLGYYEDQETFKACNKNLVLSPYSLSLVTGTEEINLYNNFYSFKTDNISKTASKESTTYYTGSIYLAVSQFTQNNMVLSLVYPDESTLTYLDIYTDMFKTYKNELSNSTYNTSSTYTFSDGIGMNNILNYIPSLDNDYFFNEDFEIQNGELIYVGTLYQTEATNAGITIGEEIDVEIKAILNTAYAYDVQGKDIQYDMNNNRRLVNIEPEAASSSYTVYLDCSSYVNSVYYNTFGQNILDGSGYLPTTLNFYKVSYEDPDIYGVVKLYRLTDDEKNDSTKVSATIQEIKDTLQPGDILNYRHGTNSTYPYRGTSGHVMLYLGDGKFIHCTGSSYTPDSSTNPLLIADYANTDIKEKSKGAIVIDSWDVLFESDEDRYLFTVGTNDDVKSISIIRPLNRTTVFTSLTDEAIARLSIPNVDIEKSCSIDLFNNVKNNTIITYTITLKNNNNYKVSFIDIKDTIDSNLELIASSATTNYILNNNIISWSNVSVSANSTVTYSYSVKVNNTNLNVGDSIVSNGTVNGVSMNPYTLYYVEDSITASEVNEYISSSHTSCNNTLTYVNELYGETIFNDSASIVIDSLINASEITYSPNTSSIYYDYLIPTFYNGTYFAVTENGYDTYERIRLVKSSYLEPGDVILITYYLDSSWVTRSFIYTEQNSVGLIYELTNSGIVQITNYDDCPTGSSTGEPTDTSKFLSRISGTYQYVILRPSLVGDTE